MPVQPDEYMENPDDARPSRAEREQTERLQRDAERRERERAELYRALRPRIQRRQRGSNPTDQTEASSSTTSARQRHSAGRSHPEARMQVPRPAWWIGPRRTSADPPPSIATRSSTAPSLPTPSSPAPSSTPSTNTIAQREAQGQTGDPSQGVSNTSQGPSGSNSESPMAPTRSWWQSCWQWLKTHYQNLRAAVTPDVMFVIMMVLFRYLCYLNGNALTSGGGFWASFRKFISTNPGGCLDDVLGKVRGGFVRTIGPGESMPDLQNVDPTIAPEVLPGTSSIDRDTQGISPRSEPHPDLVLIMSMIQQLLQSIDRPGRR